MWLYKKWIIDIQNFCTISIMNFDALYTKSYQVTLIMLVCITVLVFFRSINSNLSSKSVLSLQLSGFVTMIASMHYYLMITNKDNVVAYRYFDWFFTTPILLIDLCLLLDIYDPNFVFELIMYNTLMLVIGFAGEQRYLSILMSTIIGFVPLGIMFIRLRNRLMQIHASTAQWRIFNVFFGLWSIYGINNLVTNRMVSNLVFNGLDLLTKGAFALFIYSETFSM